jgi:hypothetical protein
MLFVSHGDGAPRREIRLAAHRFQHIRRDYRPHPCADLWRFVAQQPSIGFLFVNDGSSDATLARLRELEAGARESFAVLDLPRNLGKAEAVRAGLCVAFKSNARYVVLGRGPRDAARRSRAVAVLEPPGSDRPGARCSCSAGRCGAAGASLPGASLRRPSLTCSAAIYHTQCGAKLRANTELAALFDTPSE